MNAGTFSFSADHVEHPQHGLVGSAVERPVEGGDPGGHRRERVDTRGADAPHGVRRAILLVVGMQDQERLERSLEHEVLAAVTPDLEGHVRVVADVVEIVPRQHVRQPVGVPVDVGGNGRQLRDQPDPLEVAVLRVVDVLRIGIERRERSHRPQQHPHRVRVVAESLEELRDALVHVGVDPDVLFPSRELRGRWELALEQQVRDLEEPGGPGELLDRIPAIAEDPGVAVDVGDRAPAGRGVQERGIVRDEAAQIGRSDRPVHDRHRVALSGAVIGDRDGLLCHAL